MPFDFDNFEDWGQIIVLLLVVGGSVVGAVSKKLIDAFTPKEGPGSSPSRRGIRRVPAPAPTPASPIPSAPSAPTRRPPHRAHGPVRQAPPPGRPASVPRAAQPVQSKQRSAPPRPPVTARRPPEPTRAREKLERAPLGSLEKAAEPADAGIRGVLGQLVSIIEKTGAKEEAAAPQRRGLTLSSVDDAYSAPRATRTSATEIAESFRRHTFHRERLRQAILLSEILGPPLALRPSDERLL